ncbi:TPA: pentapeptide repeat-containing protein, partial [Klebsiella pneumoniae]|nr:pentapeptide repeat-containing protein [Klebsiella pneumoniae]
VNLQHAEINDIKFYSGDIRVFERVDLSNAKFNNVSFEGASRNIFKLSNVNLKDSKVMLPTY